jgi:acylphosphatase
MLSSGMGREGRGSARKANSARRWFVRGRVQGVGYRYFAQHAATGLGLAGYARNLDDGRVEVYAVGPEAKLSELAGVLFRGPRWADVRGVDEQEAEPREYGWFQIEP